MEAIAKHAFTATADDELSFCKNDVLKVISQEDDHNWYKAECHGREGYIPNNYIEMKKNPWFIGRCSRCDAEKKLLQKRPGTNTFIHPDGAFLIRYSESAPGDFSMSVKWFRGKVSRAQAEKILLQRNGLGLEHPDGTFLVRLSESQPGEFSISVKVGDNVQHFKILRDGAGKYFLWVQKFDSINQLIEHHKSFSVSRADTIYLREMDDCPRTPKQAIALYDFKEEDSSEVNLCKGDCLIDIQQVDQHWWKGTNSRTRKTGLFPASYVCEKNDD